MVAPVPAGTIPLHLIWRTAIESRLGAARASLSPELKGTIQLELWSDDGLPALYALVLDGPRSELRPGAAYDAGAWIVATEEALFGTLDDLSITVHGDRKLVALALESLISAPLPLNPITARTR